MPEMETMPESGDDSENEMAITKLAEGCGKTEDIYATVYSDNESHASANVKEPS